ncbi:MAG: hypothetical protein GY758_06355 [Fuerstiella sp.]|nr:hypothetical protein [Fuerstiella sp.]
MVGQTQSVSPPYTRQFFENDAIGFGFGAVNGFEIQGVSEQEANVFGRAQIGQPVPVEGGFTAHNQIVLVEGLKNAEESFRGVGGKVAMRMFRATVIEQADVE